MIRENSPRIGVIVAARTGSSRLPGKVLLPINKVPLIIFLLNRIKESKSVEKLVMSTSNKKADDELVEVVKKAGFEVFRGSENDVAKRFIDTADHFDFDYVVRVTGDCPFVNAESLDFCVRKSLNQFPFDIASTKGLFPVGIDYEIYRASELERLYKLGVLSVDDREHVTQYFYKFKQRYKFVKLEPPSCWKSQMCYTVDTQDDYKKAIDLVACQKNKNHFSIRELVKSK